MPLSVRFADLSEPSGQIDSWIWDFGDGGIAAEQNPNHAYKVDGIYSVRLTVSNSSGADTETKVNLIGAMGSAAPIAEFTASPTAGQSPLRVSFTDNSTGDRISSRVWDFGDRATSAEQNTVHTYKAAGAFTVNLTVSGSNGADTETKTNLIQIVEAGAPVAGFSADAVLGIPPFDVQFIDNSVGDITSWLWDFGDGASGTEQKVSHAYTKTGEFTVSLTVSGGNGSYTTKKERFIKVVSGGEIGVTPTPTPQAGTPVPPTPLGTPVSTPTPTPTPTPMPTPAPKLTTLTVKPATAKKSLRMQAAVVTAVDEGKIGTATIYFSFFGLPFIKAFNLLPTIPSILLIKSSSPQGIPVLAACFISLINIFTYFHSSLFSPN